MRFVCLFGLLGFFFRCIIALQDIYRRSGYFCLFAHNRMCRNGLLISTVYLFTFVVLI